MKREEVEELAEKISNSICGASLQYHKSLVLDGAIAGAEMVNKRQPYSVEDMKDFADYVRSEYRYNDNWDELIKLWEESK